MFDDIFSTTAGHDHDGANSKAVVTGVPGAGVVTNTMLATDVKVGSLAALTTTAKGSVQAAINELDADTHLPGTGTVTDDMLATDVKVGSLAALTTTAAGNVVAAINEVDALATAAQAPRYGTVALQGAAGACGVAFGVDTAAAEAGSVAATEFDLSGVGDGATMIINPNGTGAQTATINAAAGTSVSGAAASEDISAGADTTITVSVDADTAEDVVLVLAGLNTGAGIAAALQVAIRALGGAKTLVTVVWTTVYTITSTELGTASAVTVTVPAGGFSLVEELKLGTVGGGTETAGTGDCTAISAVTIPEIIAVCVTDFTGLTCTGATEVNFTSTTVGAGSSLVFGNGTAWAALGFTDAEAHYGLQGLGYATDMADALFAVVASPVAVAQGDLPAETIGITSQSATGFVLDCETAASVNDVHVIIVGNPA